MLSLQIYFIKVFFNVLYNFISSTIENELNLPHECNDYIMVKQTTAIAFFVLIVMNVMGQNFSVSGTVRDKKTLHPIYRAIVKLNSSTGTTAIVYSDTGGHYVFDSTAVKPNTTYTLNAEEKSNITWVITSILNSQPLE